MLELLEFIIKSLVKNQEAVNIETKIDGNAKVFTVNMASSDLGAVIGKNGNTASAIRTIVKSNAKQRERIIIKFNGVD